MENGITKTVVTTMKVAKETRVMKAGTKTKMVKNIFLKKYSGDFIFISKQIF